MTVSRLIRLSFQSAAFGAAPQNPGRAALGLGGEMKSISEILRLVNCTLKGHKDDVPRSNANVRLVTWRAAFHFRRLERDNQK